MFELSLPLACSNPAEGKRKERDGVGVGCLVRFVTVILDQMSGNMPYTTGSWKVSFLFWEALPTCCSSAKEQGEKGHWQLAIK